MEVDADADVHFRVEAEEPVEGLAEQFARVAMVVRNGLRDGMAIGQLPQQAPREQHLQQAPQEQPDTVSQHLMRSSDIESNPGPPRNRASLQAEDQ